MNDLLFQMYCYNIQTNKWLDMMTILGLAWSAVIRFADWKKLTISVGRKNLFGATPYHWEKVKLATCKVLSVL